MKTWAISTIVMVVMIMGLSTITPALATHNENHSSRLLTNDFCSDFCQVWVDVNDDGRCNFDGPDIKILIPNETFQHLRASGVIDDC